MDRDEALKSLDAVHAHVMRALLNRESVRVQGSVPENSDPEEDRGIDVINGHVDQEVKIAVHFRIGNAIHGENSVSPSFRRRPFPSQFDSCLILLPWRAWSRR